MSQLDLFAAQPRRPGELCPMAQRIASTQQKHRLTWRGIEIEIRYVPDWAGSDIAKLLKHKVAWLEIDARPFALPISETGYLSHYNRPDNIGDPVDFVRAVLDAKAAARDTKRKKVC